MGKFGRGFGLVALLLGLEIAREWYVLRRLGYEPGRYVEWLKGDADA